MAFGMNPASTPYDDIRYPARSFEYTHPNRLASIAALYGMKPASIRHCRVLELGCGVGGNIVPMAYQYPESEFVGIDLSASAIAQGQKGIDALGLPNITMRHLDILDVDDSLGGFDYIITHGVYSWVPANVRDKILDISRRHLNPHGVSYVSYNAHPYSRLRDMVRDMMLFHTGQINAPAEKVAQARAIAKFVTDGTPEDTVHGQVMRYQYKRIERVVDQVLFHDDLNAASEAFLLHQVVEAAAQHDLQYLGDVDFARQDLTPYTDDVRAVLASFPPDALVVKDQYQDFLDGAGFRRTLFCHDAIKLQRTVATDFIKPFFLSAPMKAKSEPSLADDTPVTFDASYNTELTATDPLFKTACLSLGQAWPSTMAFNEVVDEAFARLNQATDAVPRTEGAVENLTIQLSDAARRGVINFRFDRTDVVTTISERPEASPVARYQALNETLVTNLLHCLVVMENEMSRRFLTKIDGTRTIDELAAEMARLNREAMIPEAPPAVNELLRGLASSALLIR
jgi:methyltransferase-like protein/2-polyprenyl-3-methyl-5-hydroxy-6-metoxy-1,4-benzoquinol methylase